MVSTLRMANSMPVDVKICGLSTTGAKKDLLIFARMATNEPTRPNRRGAGRGERYPAQGENGGGNRETNFHTVVSSVEGWRDNAARYRASYVGAS